MSGRSRGGATPTYVALGSSFAAGLGLGPRAPGSPPPAMRSVNGYPRQLARLTGLSLVDASSSGAKTRHVLGSGQYYFPPQIDAVTAETRVVTLTVGGNDIGYISDLTLLAARGRNALARLVIDRLWKGPRPVEARGYDAFQAELGRLLEALALKAPGAQRIVVTYPAVLPPTGTCPALGIGEADADLMRAVGDRLAQVTRDAAAEAGATLVDMARLSLGHDACADIAWVHGSRTPAGGAPFHPTLAGAQATARSIAEQLDLERG